MLFCNLLKRSMKTTLNSVINYKNYKGDDVEKEVWKILLQWFNHQTHHRGQISVLLDMIGENNDYSSLLARIITDFSTG